MHVIAAEQHSTTSGNYHTSITRIVEQEPTRAQTQFNKHEEKQNVFTSIDQNITSRKHVLKMLALLDATSISIYIYISAPDIPLFGPGNFNEPSE